MVWLFIQLSLNLSYLFIYYFFNVNIMHDWFIYFYLFLLSFTLPFFLNIFLSFSWNCYCFVFLLACLFFCLFTYSIFVSVVAFFYFVSPVHSLAFFCLLNFSISICEPNSFCFCHSCKIYFLVSIIDTDCVDRKKNWCELYTVKMELFVLQLFCRESCHSWFWSVVKARSIIIVIT